MVLFGCSALVVVVVLLLLLLFVVVAAAIVVVVVFTCVDVDVVVGDVVFFFAAWSLRARLFVAAKRSPGQQVDKDCYFQN